PAALMAATSVYHARLGARLAARTDRARLTAAFAVFMLAVGVRLLLRTPAVPGGHAQVLGRPAGVGLDAVVVLASLLLGAASGLLAGYLGVGGGIIAVPALTLLFGMGQQAAQGTSLALILVTAPFGAIEHARHGNVARALLPGLMSGALV